MQRFLVFLLLLIAFVSCSKEEGAPVQPVEIPAIINGTVYEFNVTPSDITTPDKAFLLILMNNTMYRVVFNAADSVEANAVLRFATDSILTKESREFSNQGRNALAYYPVNENEIEILFKDGRKVDGLFDPGVTNFGGTFGEQLISQWRDPNDPAKPTQKAIDDIRNFVRRYADKDGPGPDAKPTYLSVTVTMA